MSLPAKRCGMLSWSLWGGILCLVLLGGIAYQQWQTRLSVTTFHGTWITPAKPLSPFTLKGTDHAPFTHAQLKGQWTWLFFGFTRCPQLCPTTMAKLAQAYTQLQRTGVTPLPTIVMVTLDPSEDTLKKLRRYVHQFNPHFLGVSGEAQQVASFARELGIAYMQTAVKGENGKESKTIEHTGAVMVVNPTGHLQAFFNPPFSVAELVENHQLLIQK